MTQRRKQPKLVVGVGASAGGLEAFRALLEVLPDDEDMTLVLVQHLDPTHKSLLPELLSPCTKMRVQEAEQGVPLESNTVYVIRAGNSLAVNEGRLEVSQASGRGGVRLPIDHLFRSLAREYGPRSVAIVLSGAGSDGSAGIRDIKAAGGLCIVQDPETCSQAGMPSSAIDTGLVDLVLYIAKMPEALERFQALPFSGRTEQVEGGPGEAAPALNLSEEDISRLATVLDAQAGFDLRVYKLATVERRVLRRMTLAGFDGVGAYLERLRTEPAERQSLVRDLLISVTDFFRDPEAFDVLRDSVVAPLVSRADSGDTLRVWVPACATGEEAYSIAMEFLDCAHSQSKRVRIQIFATDVDQDALAFARTGIYPVSIAERVSEGRLDTYFRLLDGQGYQVRPLLRDVVSFAVQDLTKDPPFSRMHLVSCRNVLIYFTPETQKHVLKILHFALEPNGHLLLSTSESTGPQRELFSTVSKAQRLYRKLGPSRAISLAQSRQRPLVESQKYERITPPLMVRQEPSGADLARRAVVAAFAPPTLVVAADGTIIFTHGELESFIRIPQGENPRFELNAIIHPELATRTRGALYKCRRSRELVTVGSTLESPSTQVTIQARPAPSLGDDAVLLTFVRETKADEGPRFLPNSESPEQEAIIDQLEKELLATREDLRHTVEELETSNEELRSSSEESTSMNEELQSANEELEATTEELRSVNEELTAVNSQLREKIDQLERAHDDLTNFFSSARIATIFLDDELCIKRFTPTARDLLKIDQADIGRRVGDIARELLQNDLEREAAEVLEHLAASSREIRTSDQSWIARQALPYRTEHRRIEGVVVTFADITELKAATEKLAFRERQQSVIAKIGLLALKETDPQSFMDQVVREVRQTLDTDFCKILELQPGGGQLCVRSGVGWRDGCVGSACVSSGLTSQAGYTLQSQSPVVVEDLEAEKRFSGPSLLADHGVRSGISCAIRDVESPYGVIGVHSRSVRKFTQEDAHFLQAIGSAVGAAVARHQTRVRLAIELGVAHVLAEASGREDAFSRLLERLTTDVPGKVGEVWWLSSQEGVLVRHASYSVPFSRRSDARADLVERTYRPGEGLVGTAFERETSVWCTDLGQPKLGEEREGAREAGLSSALAIPIRNGRNILGVICLYSDGWLFADDVFLRSLDAVGRSVGDFVVRSEFEQRAYRLAAITESSHDAIISYDRDGNVTEWLVGAERLFGYTEAEMVGKNVRRIVPESEEKHLVDHIEKVFAGKADEPTEALRTCKDGRTIAVSIRSSPVLDRFGNCIGVSSTDRDISRQKESERRLLEADRQKDEFLAMLGHELRNPLSAIRSAAELIKLTGAMDPRMSRIQGVLERQSAHMAKLLDGLLDVSRIIRGKIQLELEIVDFGEICRAVASDITGSLSRRALEVVIQIPDDPVWVEADPVRLTQIIDNLLSNAVKYTEDGGTIHVLLAVEDGQAVLTVRDTGVGIEPELLPHVFEIFRQSRQNLDRSRGGLGLGLALVRSLAEMHGGQVWARSAGEGEGSEFTFRLRMTTKRPNKRASAKSNGAYEVLMIEDNADSAELLKRGLEILGHRVTLANEARQGIELAASMPFDVVLCDIGLPGDLSGYDVAMNLRAEPNTKHLLLVALTGYGRPDDKRKCTDAGFDAHLTKPTDSTTISHLISDLLRKPSTIPPPSS